MNIQRKTLEKGPYILQILKGISLWILLSSSSSPLPLPNKKERKSKLKSKEAPTGFKDLALLLLRSSLLCPQASSIITTTLMMNPWVPVWDWRWSPHWKCPLHSTTLSCCWYCCFTVLLTATQPTKRCRSGWVPSPQNHSKYLTNPILRVLALMQIMGVAVDHGGVLGGLLGLGGRVVWDEDQAWKFRGPWFLQASIGDSGIPIHFFSLTFLLWCARYWGSGLNLETFLGVKKGGRSMEKACGGQWK